MERGLQSTAGNKVHFPHHISKTIEEFDKFGWEWEKCKCYHRRFQLINDRFGFGLLKLCGGQSYFLKNRSKLLIGNMLPTKICSFHLIKVHRPFWATSVDTAFLLKISVF